ncbi:hypothetical protein [Polynucleobacter sp. MWH-Berg-3C6]|uniref:hypothetical protein n=1 Tax=Polynucleobacter sp. MWH-Berg-3C6 TaxID=1855882 RepID=UPI001C0B6DF6|nr:hypothetical protein [Polynucleobacter sp. MWH-Berg-3C6]MBU3551399.1 hypothetical protein [Polynucleobacter sp. MWH-Berg-3C6]
MSFIDKPSPLNFLNTLPLPTAENTMSAEQKYWYNRGHDDGRRLAVVKELNDGGEPVKNATYWKRQCNLLQNSLTNLQSSLYHANEQIKYLELRQVDPRKTNPT